MPWCEHKHNVSNITPPVSAARYPTSRTSSESLYAVTSRIPLRIVSETLAPVILKRIKRYLELKFDPQQNVMLLTSKYHHLKISPKYVTFNYVHGKLVIVLRLI